MQHLENDMDDLFKRAGENYSPQKGKGDWESIAKRIGDKGDASAVIMPVRNRKHKKVISLLSVLLLTVLLGLFMFRSRVNKIPSGVYPNETVKKENNTSVSAEIKTNNVRVHKKTEIFLPSKKTVRKYTGKPGATYAATPRFKYIIRRGVAYRMKISASGVNTLQEEPAVIYKASPGVKNHNADSFKPAYEKDFVDDKVNSKENIFSHGEDPGQNYGNNEPPEKMKLTEPNLQQDKPGNTQLRDDNKLSPTKKKKKEFPVLVQRKGLYFGLVTASDFSKVQSSSFQNTGFDAGLLAGYSINSRLSFETGIAWNKKVYNSEGKSFNMDEIGSAMPAGMIINDLEGQSSLVEIPIKLKYDFIQKANATFFIAGGVSSYIMTREKNMYNVTMNGNHENISGIYETNHYGFPAVANFSAGYQLNVSGLIRLRIEPFLKVPLKGMGVGKLPVTSAGLQAGIISGLK